MDFDEKWFFLWINKGTLKLPPGYEKIRKVLCFKRFIPKVMFLSAISRLDPAHNFDGKIGIWRVAEPYTAKNTSKNYNKGDVFD